MQWIEPKFEIPERLAALKYTHKNWDRPQFLPLSQMATEQRMPTALIEAPVDSIDLPAGNQLDLEKIGVLDPLMDREITLDTLLQRRLFCDGILVWSRGEVVNESYFSGAGPNDRHLLHSCSKTLTTMMVGIAVAEGRLNVEASMRSYLPELPAAWEQVTLQHVLDMATGVRSDEHYDDPDGMYWRYADAVGYYGESGVGCLQFVVDNMVDTQDAPARVFNYASYITNLLPVCLERVYERPAPVLYEEYIYQQIGAENSATLNCDSLRSPIVEGQLSLALRDFARWSLLYMRDGANLEGRQVVPAAWVKESLASNPTRRAAFSNSDYSDLFSTGEYHNQMWLPDPDNGVAAMLGIHGQFAYLNVPRDLLIVGVSSFPDQTHELMSASMFTAWDSIVNALPHKTGEPTHAN